MPIIKQSVQPRLAITTWTSRVHAANESWHDKTPILRNIIDETQKRNADSKLFFKKRKRNPYEQSSHRQLHSDLKLDHAIRWAVLNFRSVCGLNLEP